MRRGFARRHGILLVLQRSLAAALLGPALAVFGHTVGTSRTNTRFFGQFTLGVVRCALLIKLFYLMPFKFLSMFFKVHIWSLNSDYSVYETSHYSLYKLGPTQHRASIRGSPLASPPTLKPPPMTAPHSSQLVTCKAIYHITGLHQC